jgi:hypothetical protein
MADNLINSEILSISAAGANKDLTATYNAVIEVDGLQLDVPIVEFVDIKRDYNTETFDYVTIRLMLPLGDVTKVLYPNKEKLKITLVNNVLGATIRTDYVFVMTKLDPHIKVDNYNNEKHGALNSNFTVVEGECKPLNFNKLKNISVGGVYKGTVKDILISAIEKAVVTSGLNIGIDIVEINNTRVYDQLLIPDNVTALNIVDYLQKTHGVYNGGIGIYLQNDGTGDILYIYPLYRNDLFLHNKKQLQVTNVNSTALNGIDSTYAMYGDTLKILAPKSSQVDNVGNAKLLSNGSGFIAADTHSPSKRPVKITDSKVVAQAEEVKRIQIHKDVGADSLNVNTNITGNNYERRTSVLKNDNSRVLVTWANSNGRLIYPYMPVKFIKEVDNGRTACFSGVVTGIHITTDKASKMEASVLSLQLGIEESTNITGSSLSFSKLFS